MVWASVWRQRCTLPETNLKKPWKLVARGDKPASFWGNRPISPIFSGLAVSFREDNYPYSYSKFTSTKALVDELDLPSGYTPEN